MRARFLSSTTQPKWTASFRSELVSREGREHTTGTEHSSCVTQIADRIEDAFPGLQVEGVERSDVQQSSLVLRGEDAELLCVTAGKVPSAKVLVEALEKAGYTAG